MSYTKPQSVYGDKQTFDPKVLSTPKFGDIVFDGSEFNNAGTQVALSDQETLAYDFAKEPPQAATNLTFLINGSYYTYHPSNVLEKGLLVDNKQFYNPQVLKNLDQVYEQGQPISLENVGWYDDFLKKNDLSTEGILLPAGELNFKVGPGGNWKVREIGEVSDRVRFNEITGIGKVGDEYVYTANVDPIDADSAYGYYDSTGTGRGEWTKKPSGGGIFGDIGRAVASVAFGAEIAGLVTGNPYVYATLAGLRGGATGQDPLKVGLQTGLTVGIASSLGGAGGQPTGLEAPSSMATSTAAPGSFQAALPELGVQTAASTPGFTALPGSFQAALPSLISPVNAMGDTAQGLLNQDRQFLAEETANLYQASGGDLNAVQQNLIANGVDPVVAAEAANQASLSMGNAAFYDVSGAAPVLKDAAGQFAAGMSGVAGGVGGAFPGEALITSQGLLGGGATLDEFAKDIAGISTTGGSSIGITDALRGLNLANQLMAGQQQPMGMPQQQAPFQPAGVDYSGILGLLGRQASVPGIQGLLGPAQIRYPNSLLG